MQWLQKAVDALLALVPQLLLISTTHAGVAWWRGRKERVMRPGMHWVWPVVCDWLLVPINRQTKTLPRQTLTCGSGESLGVSGWVAYKIDNPLAALTTTDDWDQTIEDYACGAIEAVVSQNDLDYLLAERRKAVGKLQRRLTTDLAEYGIEVIRFRFRDFVKLDAQIGTWASGDNLLPTTEED